MISTVATRAGAAAATVASSSSSSSFSRRRSVGTSRRARSRGVGVTIVVRASSSSAAAATARDSRGASVRAASAAAASSSTRRRAARVAVVVRASSDDDASDASEAIVPIPAAQGYATLDAVLGAIKNLPPSVRAEAAENATATVSKTLCAMKANGDTTRWDCYPELQRRNVFPNELRQVGIEDAEGIAKPSNTNDFNFIVAVTLSTSFLALVIGVVLPGDWGAFGSYLVGGISLAVLGAFLDRSPYATSSSSSVVRFSPHDTPRHVKRHLL